MGVTSVNFGPPDDFCFRIPWSIPWEGGSSFGSPSRPSPRAASGSSWSAWDGQEAGDERETEYRGVPLPALLATASKDCTVAVWDLYSETFQG